MDRNKVRGPRPPLGSHPRYPPSQYTQEWRRNPADPTAAHDHRSEVPSVIPGTPNILTSSNLGYYKPHPSLINNELASAPSAALGELSKDRMFESLETDPEAPLLRHTLNTDYVDLKLKEYIFTYGPFHPGKISQASVPRPDGFVYVPKKQIVYETSRHHGLIPTFGNQTILDTGSASPIYITPTFTQLPVFGGTLSDMRLPFGVLVQPFAENLDFKVPELDFLSYMEKKSDVRKDLVRCKNCMAYYNPFMHTTSRTKNRICNLCKTSFVITDEQSAAIDRISALHGKKSPFNKGSVDYIAPAHYYSKERDPWVMPEFLSRAGSMGLFKQQTKQETLIYDTYSVSPIPIDRLGNYQSYPTTRATTEYEGTQGEVEYKGPPELSQFQVDSEDREPKYPTYAFLIETTNDANKLNLRFSVISAVVNALDEITDEVFDLFVFIFDVALYAFPVVNGSFTVSLVNEITENFTPCAPSEVFVRVTNENREFVKDYLNRILEVETIKMAPNSCGNFALNCAIRVMATGNHYGTVSIFYVTQPDVGLGTDPQTFPSMSFTMTETHKFFYDMMLQMCYQVGICVDIYLCPAETRIQGDITLQHISQQTGGNCVYMPRFTHKFDYFKIHKDIVRLFTVPCGYKCELKLRTSKHIKVSEVLCGFHNSRAVKNPSTLEVPRIGPDLSIAFELSMNHMVDNKTNVFVQCACLYTNSKGVPMVRVHTQFAKVITSVNEVFKNANQDAIMNIMARRLVHSYIRTGKVNREKFISVFVEALSSYRNICAPSTPLNQLILPDNLRMVLGYTNFLLKYDVTSEHGFEFVIKMLSMLNSSPKMTYFLYTRTYVIHRSIYEPNERAPEDGYKFVLVANASSTSHIQSDGLYIMDDGHKLLLFVGPHVRVALIEELFGKDFRFPNNNVNSVELVDTPTSRNLMGVVEELRRQHRGCPFVPFKIMTYTAKNSKFIKTLMLEDELNDEPNYIDFLVLVHKKIKEHADKVY